MQDAPSLIEPSPSPAPSLLGRTRDRLAAVAFGTWFRLGAGGTMLAGLWLALKGMGGWLGWFSLFPGGVFLIVGGAFTWVRSQALDFWLATGSLLLLMYVLFARGFLWLMLESPGAIPAETAEDQQAIDAIISAWWSLTIPILFIALFVHLFRRWSALRQAVGLHGQDLYRRACKAHDPGMLPEAIAAGFDPNRRLGGVWSAGHTPLALAIFKNQPRMVERLLEVGADPKAPWSRHPLHAKPHLELARRKKRDEIVSLLESADMDR